MCLSIGVLCVISWITPITGDCPFPRLRTLKPTEYYDQGSWPTGAMITFECRPGYTKFTPRTPLTSTCLADGTWTPVTPCKKKNCKYPGEVLNGKIIFENEEEALSYGSSYRVECEPGFNLVGSKQITCITDERDGMVWSAPLPQCEVTKCIPPQVTTNVNFQPQLDVYSYRESISFSCEKQNPVLTLVGQPTAYCTESGTWSTTPPECKLVKCPVPSIPNGRISPQQSKPYSYNQQVKVDCIDPFIIQGPETITCQSNNEWHPSLPSCIPKPVYQPTEEDIGDESVSSTPNDDTDPSKKGNGKFIPCLCCNK